MSKDIKPWNLISGKATEILESFEDCSIDSVVTDPPSGTNLVIPFRESDDEDRYLAFDSPLGKLRANFKTTHSVNMRLRNEFKKNVWPVLKECQRVMKPGSYGVFWGFPRSSHWLAWGLEEAGLSVIDIIIRRTHKRRPKSPLVDGERSTQLVQEVEHWVLVRKPGEDTASKTYKKWGTGYMNVVKNFHRINNLWETFLSPAKETSHPTEKPVDLMRELVRLVTPEKGVVLDPFMGTGATGIASYLEGRKFVGIDMDPKYVEDTKERLESLTREIHDQWDERHIAIESDEELPGEMNLGQLFGGEGDE